MQASPIEQAIERGQRSQGGDGAGLVAGHAAPVVARVAALDPVIQLAHAAGIGDGLLLRQQRRHCKRDTMYSHTLVNMSPEHIAMRRCGTCKHTAL